MSDYDRIAKAISFVAERATVQPSLEEMAAHIHLSPFHFQRIFCRWTGTTPKRFLQVMTLERGKKLLDQSRPLLDVAASLGLSSSSRLHDHFVRLEAVTPGEYKKQGEGLYIEYGVHSTPFGRIFVAVTTKGVCRAAFLESKGVAEQLADLRLTWPLAVFASNDAKTQAVVHAMFGAAGNPERPLSLYVAGTHFQVAVWRALLQIPPGTVASYRQVATAMGRPKSARAVGNAIGANPVALLVPCHRVIQQSGALGGYRWGQPRKQMIQVWERVRTGVGRS
jgi:AraC family transcriptional regulator of adaptative response/methylated-DNA-[protein]-cysteine methyltransferase